MSSQSKLFAMVKAEALMALNGFDNSLIDGINGNRHYICLSFAGKLVSERTKRGRKEISRS